VTALPLSAHADESQVTRVKPLLEGRNCVVVGSAPLPTNTAEILPGECVIAVNGSISSFTPPADLWVMNSKLQDKPGDGTIKPMHKTMLRQGKGRTAGHLLLLRGPKVASEGYTLATLEALGVQYQSWSVLDKPTKRWFEGQVCHRTSENRPCSAGVLVTAIALWCGAAHVRMVGFSFSPGYQYLPKVQPAYWWRDHVDADRRALKALATSFGDRLSGPILAKVAA
jgi:hypothetical protein